MQREKRRLVAIVAADVVGFSRLIGQDEEETLRALRGHRADLIDPLIDQHGGRIANTAGDSLLLEFPSAVDAVRCSVAFQKGMADRNAGQDADRLIRFRIGINVGDVIAEGDDLFGDAVNIAARLEGQCEPGAILLSDDAYRQVRNRVDIDFDCDGQKELKNIAEPVTAWRWPAGEASASLTAPVEDARPPLPDKPSIAVLPFDNMSGDPDQDYFSDGISEDLTTALSRFDGLFVIARNSAFTYKGEAVDVKKVGRELGVRYVLEGSVRRAGDRVRVNAQLIDAESGLHVWAERFDRQMEDVFELQDEIVARIAATVGPEITLAEINRARGKRPETLDAWDHYLRAIAAYHRMTKEDVAESISLLNKALEIEPDFANASALLGLCHAHIGMHGWIQPVSQAFDEALHITKAAVRLAPSSPETNQALALVLWATGQAEQSVTAARHALELNPNYAEAYAVLSLALTFSGELEEGLAASHKAARCNPRDTRGSRLYDAMGHAYFMLGDYEKAIEVSKKCLYQDPSVFGAMVTLAGSYAYLGQEAEAKRYIDELLCMIPRYSLRAIRKNPMFVRPEHIDKLIESMRLAGLPE